MTTLEFDKKVICGPEFVALRILENCDTLKIGDIYVPNMTEENARLAFCIIENCGSKAAEEYGIKEGDYVMIDRLATFAHTAPVALVKYNNVICLTNKDRSEFKPLRNMLFVEPEDKEAVSQVGGVWVPGAFEKLNDGFITEMNCDAELNLPFTVGDKVLVTKGADVMDLGQQKVYIYKHDMIICTIEGEGR